jgi:N-acetylglucosamine kinase-like BadF-type ATPase
MADNCSLLALDAGQTGIRSLMMTRENKSEREFAGLRTDMELFPQLARVILDLLADEAEPLTLAIGMTGLTKSQSNPDALLELLNGKVNEIHLAHDSITGYLGSMGLSQGTVTAAGTGVVTLSVGPQGLTRVDGWGNLIGDAGSAYWIGRAGLEAGMKAYDGRIGPTRLSEILWDNFTHPEEAYIELQTNHNRVATLASFAKQVIDLAEDDSAAKEIVESAGRELALSAAAAARQSGLAGEISPKFSWAGNLMRADALREAFISNLVSIFPGASIAEPIAEPIEGVALLPSIPAESPLLEVVYSSRITQNSSFRY